MIWLVDSNFPHNFEPIAVQLMRFAICVHALVIYNTKGKKLSFEPWEILRSHMVAVNCNWVHFKIFFKLKKIQVFPLLKKQRSLPSFENDERSLTIMIKK